MREMNNLLELPVFQIVGGSEGEQKKFAQRLLRELEMYSIQAVILENNRCTLHHMYSLVKTNDLVLVIGKSNFQLQTILIDGNDGDSGGDLFQIVCPKNSFHQCIDELMHRLKFLLRKTPVWACILIGGKSSRMGVPKHLIKADNGRTWLENSLNKLYPLVDGVVIVGDGVVPEGLKKTARLPDIPGVVGPLTGILAARLHRFPVFGLPLYKQIFIRRMTIVIINLVKKKLPGKIGLTMKLFAQAPVMG